MRQLISLILSLILSLTLFGCAPKEKGERVLTPIASSQSDATSEKVTSEDKEEPVESDSSSEVPIESKPEVSTVSEPAPTVTQEFYEPLGLHWFLTRQDVRFKYKDIPILEVDYSSLYPAAKNSEESSDSSSSDVSEGSETDCAEVANLYEGKGMPLPPTPEQYRQMMAQAKEEQAVVLEATLTQEKMKNSSKFQNVISVAVLNRFENSVRQINTICVAYDKLGQPLWLPNSELFVTATGDYAVGEIEERSISRERIRFTTPDDMGSVWYVVSMVESVYFSDGTPIYYNPYVYDWLDYALTHTYYDVLRY